MRWTVRGARQAAGLRAAPERHHRLRALVFRAEAASCTGPPTEANESDRIEWIPISEVPGMIDRRELVSSGSLVGLLYLLLNEATGSS